MPSINAVPLEGNSQESSRSPTQNPIDRSRVLPSKRGFKLASLNINKLTTHLDELKIFLVSNDIDVLAINETKLNEYITDNEVSISGYDIVRRDRTTYGGGGVCFYVKKSINFSVRNDLCMDSLENLCIEIRKPRSKSFIVATWYRPPNSLVSIFSPFEELIGKLDSLNTEFYLLGDLNCNMTASQFDSDTRKLLTITDVYGLQQLITEPTRITETSATLIDLIFTNCPDKVLCSGVRHIGISDHSMVYVYRKLAINGQSKGHTNITYRNFRSFDRDKFRSDVASQDWDHINNSSNPNDIETKWLVKAVFPGTKPHGLSLGQIKLRTRATLVKRNRIKKSENGRIVFDKGRSIVSILADFKLDTTSPRQEKAFDRGRVSKLKLQRREHKAWETGRRPAWPPAAKEQDRKGYH
ncbi:uncharacterized protein [Montipora capricornis]|uniref:uncharacterized protein n=1 Tax=Montipora capricornis TaxID=246305 RepID=UPI0035F134DE